MLTIHLWINTTKNSNSPDQGLPPPDLSDPRDPSNPWPTLLAEVLRSWQTTIRAALLLALVVLLVVAIILAHCTMAPFTIFDICGEAIRWLKTKATRSAKPRS